MTITGYKWIALAGLSLCLAGCGNGDNDLTVVTLEPAAIQGSSFDEPASPKLTTESIALINSTPAPKNPDDVASAIVASVDNPLGDISKIPTATPVVPQPSEASEVQEAAVTTGPTDQPFPDESAEFDNVAFTALTGYTYVEPVPQEGSKPEDNEAQRMKEQIPADVKALHGKDAVVQGWMVPMEVSDDGSVKSFVLVNTQPQCCFGDTQMMNEWIDVTMAPGRTAEFNVDRPVKVYGRLEIGEKVEDGFVLSIYRMKAVRSES